MAGGQVEKFSVHGQEEENAYVCFSDFQYRLNIPDQENFVHI